MRTEFETDTEMLKRIAAMLVALAVLADRACSASGPVRWFVLLLLRPAVAAAQAIVVDVTHLPEGVVEPAGLRRSTGITDAMRLAHEFRVLAAALYEYLLWCAWAASQGSGDDQEYNANIRSIKATRTRSSAMSALTSARAWRLRIDDS